MKNQLRKLKRLENILPMELFYCINVRDSCIDLQGEFSSVVVKQALANKFIDRGIEPINGYVELTRDNIKITLT